jgi:hypothetical protein
VDTAPTQLDEATLETITDVEGCPACLISDRSDSPNKFGSPILTPDSRTCSGSLTGRTASTSRGVR